MIELTQANAVRIPLADESVQVCVTSPPYFGLRSYSLSPLIWGGREECRHVWTEESTVVAGRNDGDRSRLSQGSYNGGGEDKYYVGKQKASQGQFCRLCGAWKGNLGLEPTIDLYVQHLVQIFREVRRVLRKDGQLFLNISDSRTKDRQWHGIPHKLVFALQADGWRWEDEIIWEKPNCMPGSQTNRFTRSHEFVFMLNKSGDAFFDMGAVKEQALQPIGNAKLTGQRKRAKAEPGAGKYQTNLSSSILGSNQGSPYRSRRSVWTIPTKGYKGSHFAVFPEALVTPCIKAGTSEKGCCPKCGKAWVRVVARSSNLNTERPQARRALELVKRKGLTQEHIDAIQAVGMADAGKALLTMGGAGKNRPEVQRLADEAKQLLGGYFREFTFNNRVTTGWRPACDCWKTACDERGMTYDEDYEHFNHLPEWLPELTPVPCIVLDPFCGSGTTLLAARKLSRSAIGLDLSYPYLDQARTRLELDKLSEWESGREPAQTNLDDLPLWAAKNT